MGRGVHDETDRIMIWGAVWALIIGTFLLAVVAALL